jgi:hypothetical protein
MSTLRRREKSSRLSKPVSRAVLPRRVGLAARRRLGQRERERDIRVSDADASYYRPIMDAKTLNNAIPQRMHAKNNSLSEVRPGPSPKVPVKTSWRRPRRPTQNPTLCTVTARTLQTPATYTRHCRCCQPLSRAALPAGADSGGVCAQCQDEIPQPAASCAAIAAWIASPRVVSLQALASPLVCPCPPFSISSQL